MIEAIYYWEMNSLGNTCSDYAPRTLDWRTTSYSYWYFFIAFFPLLKKMFERAYLSVERTLLLHMQPHIRAPSN